jgi:cell division septation protein DedD
MRGPVAESRSNVNNYKGEGGARAAGGYSLKPSGQSEASSSNSRRGAARTNEVRLGKLQVMVWLGLALGSIVGAYFVGFFSGRYVGFESARESSAGEVAKLPVPEAFQGTLGRSPVGVYDKLKAPAVLRDSEESPTAAKGRAASEAAAASARVEEIKREVEAADDGEEPVSAVRGEDIPAGRAIEAEASEKEIESLIDEPQKGPEIIIGSDEGLTGGKVPDSVRLLGAGKTAGTGKADTAKDVQAKVTVAPKADKSATTLLDERIANARSDSAKASQSAEVVAKTSGKDSGSLVRKVVPSGYFAQVAAPKKLSEAESIAGKLKRSGFPVVVESASVAGQSFFRVLVGPEQNKLQADRLVSQLKSERYISGDPFIRKVK